MTLAFGSMHRLDRILLRTKDILGDGNELLLNQNKQAALQFAAAFYDLYEGDGSETEYRDKANLSLLESELIATFAAIELINTALSFYKDDVTEANAGPATAKFRLDKLNWLKELLRELQEKKEGLKSQLGFAEQELNGPPALLKKVPVCEEM